MAERESLNRSRRVAALFGFLVLILVAGPVAWWYGPFLRERAYWLMHVKPAAPGERMFTECTHCPEMVVLRAGKYKMGSLPGLGDKTEFPQHEVTFDKPFAIGKTEVTFDQWEACVHYGDCASDISTAGWGRGRQPVVNVSWLDAQRYVNWLSRVTGQNYRLPTEAEWEYAARGGRETHYSFGPDEAILGDYGWFAGNAEGRSHPVAARKPNPFGLNDMHGNVTEWVEDCFTEHYRNASPTGLASLTGNCGRRVVRGGSFQDRARALRSATRDWSVFDKPEKYIGFRVVRTMPP